MAEPVSVVVDTSGTGREPDAVIARRLARAVDLTPRGIRTRLGLDRPIHACTSAYGHFGRAPEVDGGFSRERTDLAGESGVRHRRGGVTRPEDVQASAPHIPGGR